MDFKEVLFFIAMAAFGFLAMFANKKPTSRLEFICMLIGAIIGGLMLGFFVWGTLTEDIRLFRLNLQAIIGAGIGGWLGGWVGRIIYRNR